MLGDCDLLDALVSEHNNALSLPHLHGAWSANIDYLHERATITDVLFKTWIVYRAIKLEKVVYISPTKTLRMFCTASSPCLSFGPAVDNLDVEYNQFFSGNYSSIVPSRNIFPLINVRGVAVDKCWWPLRKLFISA